HRLGHRGHRVRGVHPPAGALARADRPFDAPDVLAAHQPAGAGTHGLEGVDDRHFFLGAVFEFHPAGHDRSRVDEHARKVEPGRDLSPPASITEPPSRSAIMTVSTESAMTSRETRE